MSLRRVSLVGSVRHVPVPYKSTMLGLFLFTTGLALVHAQCGDPPDPWSTWSDYVRVCAKYGGHIADRRCVGWDTNWCHRGRASDGRTSPPTADTDDHERQEALQRQREDERLRSEEERKRQQEQFEKEKQESLRELKGISTADAGGVSTNEGLKKANSDSNSESLKQSPPELQSVDLRKAVDPRVLVTSDLDESAKLRLAFLRQLEARLVAKQAELRTWHGHMLAEKREFDHLHAEAAHGELAEVIEIIPADAVANHMLKRGIVSVESAENLKKTFERLKKACEAIANIAETQNEQDLVKVQIDTTQETITQLIEIGKKLPLNSPEREWDMRTVKALRMFGAAAKAILGKLPAGEAKWWEHAGPVADILADLTGVAIPPFGMALAGERITDREVRKYIVTQARHGLGSAVADSWNASVYLSLKLDRVRRDIADVQRTVESYESLRSKAKE